MEGCGCRRGRELSSKRFVVEAAGFEQAKPCECREHLSDKSPFDGSPIVGVLGGAWFGGVVADPERSVRLRSKACGELEQIGFFFANELEDIVEFKGEFEPSEELVEQESSGLDLDLCGEGMGGSVFALDHNGVGEAHFTPQHKAKVGLEDVFLLEVEGAIKEGVCVGWMDIQEPIDLLKEIELVGDLVQKKQIGMFIELTCLFDGLGGIEDLLERGKVAPSGKSAFEDLGMALSDQVQPSEEVDLQGGRGEHTISVRFGVWLSRVWRVRRSQRGGYIRAPRGLLPRIRPVDRRSDGWWRERCALRAARSDIVRRSLRPIWAKRIEGV